jgi:hypothetical protein
MSNSLNQAHSTNVKFRNQGSSIVRIEFWSTWRFRRVHPDRIALNQRQNKGSEDIRTSSAKPTRNGKAQSLMRVASKRSKHTQRILGLKKSDSCAIGEIQRQGNLPWRPKSRSWGFNIKWEGWFGGGDRSTVFNLLKIFNDPRATRLPLTVIGKFTVFAKDYWYRSKVYCPELKLISGPRLHPFSCSIAFIYFHVQYIRDAKLQWHYNSRFCLDYCASEDAVDAAHIHNVFGMDTGISSV